MTSLKWLTIDKLALATPCYKENSTYEPETSVDCVVLHTVEECIKGTQKVLTGNADRKVFTELISRLPRTTL